MRDNVWFRRAIALFFIFSPILIWLRLRSDRDSIAPVRQPERTAPPDRSIEGRAAPLPPPAIEPAPVRSIALSSAKSSTLWARLKSLDNSLFALALALFLLTRLIGLENFPIYFFTDEAIQTVQAADFVHHGLQGPNGEWFPTYFQNGTYYNLSTSVYVQTIPYLLFGFSEFATRATSVLIAFSGMIAIGLILKRVFKIKFWWIGVLLLSITPAWFLHSRTAFETAEAVALYAWFLYFYLRYRYGRPRNLYGALLFGALTFYTYSPAQAIVVVTGLLLLLSDLRYHVQTLRVNRRVLLLSSILAIVLVLPYVRFQSQHPTEPFLHLRTLDSYLTDVSLTAGDKLNRFIQTYADSLSPAYWYTPDNQRDLFRHTMKGYGHILLITLPFALLGLALALRRIKASMYRLILIALFVTPLGTALVQVQVYRALTFVIPVGLLTAIGLASILTWLTRRVAYRWLAIGSFVVLGTINVGMLNDALTNGPTWYNDYGLGGMQWGARQVFSAVEDYLQREPQTYIVVSPTWANGTDVLLRFFIDNDPRVWMGNIDAYKTTQLNLNDNVLFVMTPDEYQRTIDDPKFTNVQQVQPPLKYPDGRDGFYFVKLAYSDQAASIFAAEEAARKQPVEEDYVLDGQTVHTVHSRFDVGQVNDLFDRDTYTLVRTEVDNPFFIEITFPQPRQFTGLTLTTGTMDFTVTVKLYADANAQPAIFTQKFVGLPPDPTVNLNFDPVPVPATRIRIEVKDVNAPSEAKLHIREIVFK
jgi:hypothetical protein